MSSSSNRGLLVNDLIGVALYAGIRVVFEVGMESPHDGRSRVRPPRVLCAVQIGRNEPTGIASPTSRQGHRGSTSEERTNTVNPWFGRFQRRDISQCLLPGAALFQFEPQAWISDARVIAFMSDHHGEIEKPGLNPFAQAFSVSVLDEYERAPSCLEALGALNRWPGRTGIPIDEYLRQWEASCAELQASSILPTRIRGMLNIA